MKQTMATTRALQLGLIFLLAVCSAQVLWWFYDQERHTEEINARLRAMFEADRHAAQQLHAAGRSPAALEAIFPHLEVRRGAVAVRDGALEELSRQRFHRLNRYGWEGGFFLLVLVAAMAVVWRAQRQDAALRLRQQNFVAAVSHELRSPLASLRLSAETLALRDPEPERARRLVARLLDDLRRLDDLVHKILDASRLERGRFELEAERFRLSALVDEVLAESRPSTGDEPELRLVNAVPAGLELEADPTACRTVLRNLVENAIKAVRRAGGGRVSITAARREGGLLLEVSDEGVGFSPQEAGQLFDKFYRPGDELRRDTSGTGLGLYIVDRVVGLQGGRVEAHSEGPGRGATFSVWWPGHDGEEPA